MPRGSEGLCSVQLPRDEWALVERILGQAHRQARPETAERITVILARVRGTQLEGEERRKFVSRETTRLHRLAKQRQEIH